MSVLNSCKFIGYVGKQPDARYTASGQMIVKASIGVNDGYKGSDGQWVDRTQWVNLVFFGKLAERFRDSAQVGSRVAVDARYSSSTYEDQEGKKQTWHEFRVDSFDVLTKRRQRDDDNQEPGSEDIGNSGGFDNDNIPF